MDPTWNDSQPIYRQLRDKVVAMILEGPFPEAYDGAFPNCFRITTNRDVWHDAVAQWVAAHP